MKFILNLLLLGMLVSCGSVISSTIKIKKKEVPPTVFEYQYYQDLQKNIVRLHQLMQGTFVAHARLDQNMELRPWKVSEVDSVVLYTVPLGDIDKYGYWLYSYEFMTSLPDKPIYTSIKQIKQVSRDSLVVLYYQHKKDLKITLNDVLDANVLNEKIHLDRLVLQNKQVFYSKKTAANFVGYSAIYEDTVLKCLRQNTYDLSPSAFRVETLFYDRRTKEVLNRKNRPNLMVRRVMEEKLLSRIAEKS